MLYRPNSSWTWTFLVSLLLEAGILITLETVIYANFMAALSPKGEKSSSFRVPSTSFSMMIFGFVYQLLLAYDTLAKHSTPQVIGLCLYSLTLCIYNVLQYGELMDSVAVTIDMAAISIDTYRYNQKAVIVVAVITVVFTVWLSLVAYKLYGEFAWVAFHQVDADLDMRRRFVYFQLFITLLKFDAFFFLGQLVQVTIMAADFLPRLFYTNLVVIPAVSILLITTGIMVRHEKRLGTMVCLTLHLALLGFHLFLFALFYQPATFRVFYPLRRILTFFGIIVGLLSVCTIGMTALCFRQFGQGLKPYVSDSRKARMLGDTFELAQRGYSHVPDIP
ncbi:uncharacterized protein BO80DRAFT_429903 [Aspergillus ibericus CBS 121593]|uniref:Uncharacterized protein n=1 Tax=Aspergillus ibericus CBS 121593 TaxID=1448316 RepID=A0A395GN39_9EURO|nr:hypothetical protein BO80DRAFT_429903 [Aspergillus ibericus CBS 121593]RAK95433.1 hypothetical protein BO80DRAFT_429903 [Aspergillus ibericus CBS 121593]